MLNTTKSIVRIAAHAIGRVIPQPVLARVEQFAATHQGKGVGIGRCDLEVAHCAALLGRVPRTIIDVGGNQGDYSAALRLRFPQSIIHVFEPEPFCIEKLKQRFGSDPNFAIHEYALSSTNESRPLWTVSRGSGLASLTRRNLNHVGMVMNEALCVECRRLNDVASATPISSVDWMKIDVEGTEMDVLKGGSDVVEMASLIQFEFGGCNIDTRSFFRDYWDFFTARGFALYRLSPRGPVRVPRYDETLEHFRTTNYVALRKVDC
jgi:FkbM family methyltransferase